MVKEGCSEIKLSAVRDTWGKSETNENEDENENRTLGAMRFPLFVYNKPHADNCLGPMHRVTFFWHAELADSRRE